MNTILKRVISLVLCFVMTIGYMPVSAFATENGETVTAVTTEVTAEQTEAASEETEAPSESTAAPAEQSEETDGSDEEEKESKKEEKKSEKESKKEEKEAEKEAKKEEKESQKETEPSTEPSTEATEPSTEATEPSTEATEPSTEATEPSTEATEPSAETNPDDLLMTLEIEDEADPVAAALEARSGVTVSSDALAEAQTYIDALTINNTSNDPATVVGNFGTHFTWDNEKRENSASYLYDWSYYNGVVFEGLEYLYEVTGKTVYKDYVEEYMSTMITSDGTWASCTNNTSKQAAGYNAAHGADCYKTASLLMDLYEMTNDSRYLTMAATLYADLDAAAKSYSLSNAGNNYRHTWASDPSPDLWLDGLYMILPFRAEYAKHIGDTEELDLIVDRMQWVSDNMYNDEKGLFYHAADSASSNSGTYWLRSIGWYAAAIVDIMDSMSGDNLEAMKTQLKKLVDGMLLVQNSTNGMWLNNMNASQSSTNPYETSGTALVCYAVMKAVNNGWLDEAYADMAVLAFNGICSEKLSGTTLTDICFKGAPGSSNSTFYDNEGKGVGPFIMLYAEVLEYTGVEPEQPEEPEVTEPTEPEDQEITVEGAESETSVTMTVSGVSAPVVAAALTEEDKTLLDAHEGFETYMALDVTGTLAEGETATFTVAIPEGWDADRMVGISVEEGVVKEIPGTHENGYFTFTVDHFSAKGIALTAEVAEEGTTDWIEILGENKTIFRLTNSPTNGKKYVIVSSNAAGNANAVNLNGTSINSASVTIIADSEGNYIEAPATSAQWTYNNSGKFQNVGTTNRYLRGDNSNGDSLRTTTSSSDSQTTWYYNNNNGLYTTRSSTNWYVNSSFKILSGGSSTNRVYIYVEEEIATESTYVRLSGELTQNYATIDGATETSVLDQVVIQTSDDGENANSTTITVTENMVDWGNKDFDGSVAGTYTGTVTYLGKELGEITVTVTAKTITKVEWITSSGTVYQNDGPAVRTGGKIKVTYSDGTEDTVNVTVGMLDADTQSIGTRDYTLIYNDVPVEGSFKLTVVERPDANYPEYPDPGSVMVDKYIADSSKFQDTGVAEINLVAAGLPASVGVDVILVTDLSNSMAWTAKTRTDASSHEGTKMYSLQKSVESFADIFLAADDDGAKTQNTISLVTFGGYDADYTNKVYTDYADPTQTLLLGSSSASAVKNTINNIRVLADDALNLGTSTTGYYLSFDGGNSWGENYGNTNYDHAFMETEAAIRALKEQYAENYGGTYDESGREIYILFMTDGAPSNYDGVYYNYKTGDRADVNCTWVNADGDEVTYTMGNNSAQYQAGPWYEYIAGGAYTNGQIPGNPLYWADQVANIPGVADIFPIGFDLDNGGFSSMVFTEAEGRPLDKVLEKLVTGRTLTVRSADSEDGLNSIYAALAADLKLAATKAYFVDQMGGYFNVQMASTVTKFAGDAVNEETITLTPRPQIKISTSTIYTPDDVNGTTVTDDMVGDVVPGTEKEAEIVTFNDAGDEAYSNVDGYEITYIDTDGQTQKRTIAAGDNIMIDNVIYGCNFWYNNNRAPKTIVLSDGSTYELPAETFYWNIGTINNVQFKMSYYVYLAGSAEGQAEEGTYATNNYAILYYKNWLDNDAEKHTDSPALAWKSASVHYGFYLVNAEGKPVTNRATGATGPIENAIKVTSKIFHDTVLLNSIENTAVIEVASTKVPEGYTVYDPGAVYKLTVNSNLEASGWIITNTVAPDTTYVTDYNGSEYTKVTNSNTIEDREGWSYTATTVWFAVLWEPSTVPDAVVIDYGLPVDISVLENDMFGSAGKLTGIGELDDKPVAEVDLFTTTHSDAFTVPEDGFEADYGKAEIVEGKVRYTPRDMQMPTYDKFAYEAQYAHPSEGLQYYYGDVTVIPATTIYYEDSFVGTTSYTWDNTANNWGAFVPSDVNGDGETDNSLWSIAGTRNNSATQAEDRPGKYSLTDANNIYGYDSANLNMSTYSLGSALKAIVNYDNKAEASFEFYGTGFDVISMTSNTTGSIYVAVYDANNNRVGTKKMVDTYYGCKQVPGDANGDGTITDGEVVWVVDPESTDAIYQVPVMKVEGLTYGKYKAVIEVIWEPLYDNIEGSEDYEFYLDAIRIYDPANDGAADDDNVIENAYKADGEGWPSYIELRNKLISADSFDEVANDVLASESDMEGLVFIDGDDSVGNAHLADYVSYGPNNEVYLAPGQRVAFLLSNVNENVAGIHIGIKSADGQRGTYTITNIAKANKDVDGKTIQAGTYYGARTFTMDTTTDMYYDLTGWRNDIIVISNTGDRSENNTQGIISITNIKATYKQDPNGVTVASVDDPNSGIMVTSLDEETASNEVGVYMTPRAATLTLRALNASAPEETPEESVPETTVPEETEPAEPMDPEVTEPEETEPEETQPDKEVEKIQKEIEKALKKAAKEAEKIAKELQKAAEKAAKTLFKLFGSWF